jgi:predicted hydrolase (HD superfamily)
LVCEYTKSENLRRHMLAVEAVMREYAPRFDGDVDTWGIVGLLHDFDYEQFPDEHPIPGEQIMAERGWSDTLRRAVLSHADRTGVARESVMEKALHASDDVTGFIVAVGLVRPDRDLGNVKMKSVRKKWKNRAFAGGVDRDEVEAAASEIGMALNDHLEVVLTAMQGISADLGLAGEG